MMDLWVSQAMGDRILLTGEVLRQKWLQFADLAGVLTDEHLCLSNGWLARYKAGNGLKEFKHHGEALSVSEQTVKKERECMQTIIKEGSYNLGDIFNMDKTGLFYGYVATHTFPMNWTHYQGHKGYLLTKNLLTRNDLV